MTRTERSQEVERLKGDLAGVRNAVLIDYRGITVPQVTDLRSQVRKTGGHYEVVKNTLLQRAIAGAPLESLKAHMKGPTALLWSDAEPVALAKTLAAFAKATPVIQVKAVLLDGVALPADQLDQVAAMPSREQLRAQVVGVLQSPLRRLVTVLAGPSRGLVTVIHGRADKVK
jgi:large subunit ribosomal protein L10